MGRRTARRAIEEHVKLAVNAFKAAETPEYAEQKVFRAVELSRLMWLSGEAGMPVGHYSPEYQNVINRARSLTQQAYSDAVNVAIVGGVV